MEVSKADIMGSPLKIVKWKGLSYNIIIYDL